MLLYVTALFAWFAFVLLGVAAVVALEPAWNPEAKAAREAVGCPKRRPCGGREAS